MTMQVTDNARISVPRWVRSTGAIVAGLATVVVLSSGADAIAHGVGFYPPLGEAQPGWTLIVALAYRTAFTVAAGYLTAMLAPRNGLKHAVILGIIGTLLGALGAVSMWSYGDQWYPIALTLLAVPSTWLGGWLHSRR